VGGRPMVIEEESFGVKHAGSFYQALKKELDENEEIIIDFEQVKRIDLSVVQILISAGREARNIGKMIKLKAVSENIKNQMHICGLKT